MPPGVVIVTPTVPRDPAGATAVACVAETARNAAATVPKRTEVAPAKPVPVNVTVFPPSTDPWLGTTELIAGVAIV
ncbi:hypothetical protein GCM10010207_04230 [Streptomyces atratus]|nr:hypothetical protein GCM10010207_04230 [Streptomyces atratus]